MNGAPSGSNGYVDLGITYTGAADSALVVRVQNNPSDSYLWDGANGRFKVSNCRRDSTGSFFLIYFHSVNDESSGLGLLEPRDWSWDPSAP